MGEYSEMTKKDLEKNLASVDGKIHEESFSRDISSIGKGIAIYGAVVGLFMNVALPMLDVPAAATPEPVSYTQQFKAAHHHAVEQNGLGVANLGISGIALLGGMLWGARKYAAHKGEAIEDTEFNALKEEKANIKAEVAKRHRAEIGLMQQQSFTFG